MVQRHRSILLLPACSLLLPSTEQAPAKLGHTAVTPVTLPPKGMGALLTGMSNHAGGTTPFQVCF